MLITECMTKHLAYGELQSGVPTLYYLPSAYAYLFWPVGVVFIAPNLRTSRWSQQAFLAIIGQSDAWHRTNDLSVRCLTTAMCQN
jgi:hypothetical protein